MRKETMYPALAALAVLVMLALLWVLMLSHIPSAP